MPSNDTQIYSGYLPQKYIPDLADIDQLFAGHSLLITCIDSTPLPFDHEWERAKTMQWKIEVLKNGYWIDQQDVRRVLKDKKTFVLYSEIYAFKDNRKPAKCAKLGHYTSAGCFFNQEVPDDFKKSFIALGADLYLSDGAGVNYACTSKETMLLLNDK